jgi:hypothetical protein
MGLSNASTRARTYSQLITRNQGGGNSKAGFPYQVGRSSWSAGALGCSKYQVRCCTLKSLQLTANPNVRESRPIGTAVNISYWPR